MAKALQGDADLEERFIDATIVLAHPHGAGAPRKTGAISRSRGRLSTKAHACVDALDNPIRLILMTGQVADITQSAALVDIIEACGAEAIIPARSNRNTQRKADWLRHNARNLVERFFNRLKPLRLIATRYDKLANRFNAFLLLACAYSCLL